jgi:lipopolysaccharide cholinephosphotransferase
LSKSRVIIFGVSFYGRAIYRTLRKDEDHKIVAFIDNDPSKQGHSFDGISIIDPSSINELSYDKILLGGRFIDEQVLQLTQIGINPESIELIKKADIKLTSIEREVKSNEIDLILETLVPILEENKIDYWLDYSSLLSLYRSNDLAEFSDIDIALNSQQSGIELWNLLQASILRETHKLEFMTFDSDTEFSSKGDFLKITIQSNGLPWEENAIFDIFVKYLHDNNYKHKINGNIHFCSKDFLDKYEYFEYKKFNLRVPFKVNDYLSLIYGENWIEPSDFWSSSSYGNIDTNR